MNTCLAPHIVRHCDNLYDILLKCIKCTGLFNITFGTRNTVIFISMAKDFNAFRVYYPLLNVIRITDFYLAFTSVTCHGTNIILKDHINILLLWLIECRSPLPAPHMSQLPTHIYCVTTMHCLLHKGIAGSWGRAWGLLLFYKAFRFLPFWPEV